MVTTSNIWIYTLNRHSTLKNFATSITEVERKNTPFLSLSISDGNTTPSGGLHYAC